jgi:hypothetical protein
MKENKLGTPWRICKDNIKMNLEEIGYGQDLLESG